MGPTADREVPARPHHHAHHPPVPAFSLQPLLTCGVQPADFDVIIIKGVHAPSAPMPKPALPHPREYPA